MVDEPASHELGDRNQPHRNEIEVALVAERRLIGGPAVSDLQLAKVDAGELAERVAEKVLRYAGRDHVDLPVPCEPRGEHLHQVPPGAEGDRVVTGLARRVGDRPEPARWRRDDHPLVILVHPLQGGESHPLGAVEIAAVQDVQERAGLLAA